MPKTSKKTTPRDKFSDSLRRVIQDELQPIQERVDDLEDHLITKLRLTDQSLGTSMELLEHKVDQIYQQNNKIHDKIDVVVRILNDHYLKQGIQIEKLEKIHPSYTHIAI